MLLDNNLEDIIAEIDDRCKRALWALKKREGEEVVWEIWGTFFLTEKMELENYIRTTMHVNQTKWIYGLLQTTNTLINYHHKTRLGKVKAKKELANTRNITKRLLMGDIDAKEPCPLCAKIDDHLLQLATGKCDMVLTAEIYVKDYPKKYRYEGPAVILTPKTEGTKDVISM